MKTRITVALLVLGFAFCAAAAASGAFTDLELALASLLNPFRGRNPILYFFTVIGESPGVIGVIAVLLVLPITRRSVGAPVAVTVLCSWLANIGIKALFHRARPEDRLLVIDGFSFPSGHAMNNMALYLAVMLTVLPICKNRTQRITVIVLCSVFPLLIGLSRVYFNVHYVSDVLGGWCLGAAFAVAGSAIYARLEAKHSECR